MIRTRGLLAALAFAAVMTLPAAAQETRDPGAGAREAPLIPRTLLFGNPDKVGAQVSPDGKKVAWIAPSGGVLNVWVADVKAPADAKVVTKDTNRGIRQYFWAYTNNHILYRQDKGGDENWRVYCVDLASGETRDLTPFDGARSEIEAVSEKVPGEIVVGINNRNPALHDLHRVEIATGKTTLLQQNDGYVGFVVDDDYRVRFGAKVNPDGSVAIQRKTEGGFEDFETIPMEDANTTTIVGFDKTGDVIYMIDSRGGNTSRLVSRDLKTGETTLIAQHEKTDVDEILMHPTEKTPQAVLFDHTRPTWNLLDQTLVADWMFFRKNNLWNENIGSRSLDDRVWTVTFVDDDGPAKTYIYERDPVADKPENKLTFLFSNRPALEGAALSRMHPVEIKTRDGLDMVCYLTLPPGVDKTSKQNIEAAPKSERPVPLVVYVHGGPTARDAWGFDSTHQWLANRGYAVMSVNYRGSTGYGKNFINAGNLEWAGKMHDDLLDAVEWAIKNKFTTRDKVAIMGGSYGGYATLVGLTFTPDVFACGVDIVGPSNLQTLLESIPPYWAPAVDMLVKKTGDHRTEEGRAFLKSRSPLFKVENIKRPLLIGQGANDPRVKQPESDQIVAAMKEKNIPVTYVLFPDEGHGFARPENRLAFYAVAEQFLAEHLGGRAEPIGSDFNNSSLTVPAGAEQVPGVAEALPVAKP